MTNSIFKTLLNRLTDLSTRNKSLYLPKLHGNGFIDLQDLDFLNGESSFEILRKVIQDKKIVSLIPEIDPRLGEVNQLSKQLSRIAFRDQLTQEETGDRSLFLAWPFVEGKMLNGQVLRAPVLLWACQLKKKDGAWQLHLDGTCQWNSAFLLAYAKAYTVEFDSEEMRSSLESLSKDPLEFRTNLIALLEKYFSLQLSSNLFEDRILPFPNSQISIDSNKFQDGKLAVKAFAVVGQFAQKGSYLFRDYEELAAQSSIDSIEGLLESEYQVEFSERKPREEQLFTVFPVDASQEDVLLKVRQGKSLVVEGPPGTGKSQLISNLVSDYIARGKKVLVVSQKRAALDVVFDRLSQLGMGDFLGLVHDFRGDQKALFLKLKRQIEAIENYQEENRGLDSIQLEREISLLSAAITRLSEKFDGLREALFESEQAGLPIKAMYLKAHLKNTFIQGFEEELLALRYEEARGFERKLKIFHECQRLFAESFWCKRRSFASFTAQHYPKIIELISELEGFQTVQKKVSDGFIAFQRGIIHGRSYSVDLKNLIDSIQIFQNPDLVKTLLLNAGERQKSAELKTWLTENLTIVQNLVLPIPTDLNALGKELREVGNIRSSWLGGFRLKFQSQKFQYLYQWLQKANLNWNGLNIQLAENEFDQISKLQAELENHPQIQGFAPKLMEFESQLKMLSAIEALTRDWDSVIELKGFWESNELEVSGEKFLESLSSLQDQLAPFEQQVISWKIYFTSTQLEKLLLGGTKVSSPNLLQTFTELTAFDQFLEGLGVKERELAEALTNQRAEATSNELNQIFWNSWFLQWVSELERRSPVLLEAGSLKLKQEMSELKEAILEKRKIAQFMTLLRLKEGMCDSLEFNRLGNRLTYRDLLHQVSKKRQKWPIRKLMESFGEEVFRLMPCWLASPETVSALFPLGQKFDLVIFDEASQCPVERGLPAMLRGKQVVVAGDSKQLRPSDFYQVKWESEEEGLDYEAESLLELTGSYFEKTLLKGHYRSTDPILIQFSNQKFYENSLEILPDFNVALAAKSPFSWEKVEGIWENQMNKTEAERVVERVKVIQSEASNDSIGVVTGNYFQMELIREKLWEAGVFDEKVKVRNIENVQGDEFDQVILSLGYASNREGKLLTNFGLLGKIGAENRLNVAISRARKRMHIISSIDPADFRPSQLVNPGLNLLREFLEYAKTQAKKPMISQIDIGHAKFEGNWSLKHKLQESDTKYSGQVPSSVMDLVKIENGTLSAILTDDQRFFGTATAKSAMAYHPILLESKGWEWEWKWSREVFL